MSRLLRSQLGNLHRVAAGGQGVVYLAPGLQMQYARLIAFKEYKPQALASVDEQALEAMPAYLESLPSSEAFALLSLAAWPCRTVEDAGTLVGFVMPAIPDEFFVTMNKASGLSREIGDFQHLLNDEDFLARRGLGLTNRHRYQLLAEVAQGLDVFHRHRIVVGDFSPKNLLFSVYPKAAVYFIDCDAMRLQGRTVARQLETPDWDVRAVNSGEELATPASDNYKLGLLALRLLAGDQSTRNPDVLPMSVPVEVGHLVRRALSANPADRPPAAEWTGPLRTAVEYASTLGPRQLPTAAHLGPAGVGAAPNLPSARTPLWQRYPVLAAVIALIVVVAALVVIVPAVQRATGSHTSSASDIAASNIAQADLPLTPPASAGCDGTVVGYQDLNHPTLGLMRVFAVYKALPESDRGSCIAAVTATGQTLPSIPLDVQSEASLHFANPATDTTGNIFISYNPGRYDSVLVLIPNDTGFEDIGWDDSTYGTHYSGKHAYYYATVAGPGADGRYEIRVFSNDCTPDCARGTITGKLLSWNGSDYVS